MKINKFLMATAAVAVFAAGALSFTKAYAVVDPLTVDAKIVAALQLNCDTAPAVPLDFGTMDPSTGGTVIVDTANGITYGGTVVAVAGGTPNSGQCTVIGEPSQAYNVDIPDDSIVSGANTMNVENFMVDDGNGAAAATAYNATMGAGGTDTLFIGADLVVASGQVAGTYQGTVDVTIVYD